MKRIITHALALSVIMLGYTQLSYGLFRGIVDTAETAVGGAVNVASDAVGVAGDTTRAVVGVDRRNTRRSDRVRNRRVNYDERRERLMNDLPNNY